MSDFQFGMQVALELPFSMPLLVPVGLVSAGMLIAMYWSSAFSTGAWFAVVMLVLFSVAGRRMVRQQAIDHRDGAE